MRSKEIEKIAKALGDVTRLKILQDMSKRGGSMQCSEIVNMLNLAQPSVSHHIKTLTEAGLIEASKEGRNYTYQLNKALLHKFINSMSALTKNAGTVENTLVN